MRFFPLTVCALLFALPAKADKFWLVDPATEADAPAGSAPTYIEGVLLGEDADGYRIRVAGGELVLPKASVFRIDADALTAEAIAAAEAEAAERLAAADRERDLEQQTARKRREIEVLEAALRGGASAGEEPAAVPAATPAGFDPVVGVWRPAFVASADATADARYAYELTRDRRYLRMLRQLRRLR